MTRVNAGTLSLGTRTTATVIIRDDDPTVVSLARVGNGAVSEGGTVEFTVSLGRALIAGVTTADWSLARKTGTGLNTGVTLSGESTATPNVRFSGAGAQTATLELTTVINNVAENAETLTIALGPDGAGANGFDHTNLGTNVGVGADPHTTNKSFSVVVNNVNPPSKPMGFTATAGNGQVTLGWSNPNNSAITGWQYRQKAGSGNYGSWTTISGSSATTVSHTVSGLTNGTVYAFRIRALAGTANGEESDEVTATPSATPPSVIIMESGSGTTVAEYTDGTQLTDSYEVKLATQPSHEVTVTATLLGSGVRVKKSGGTFGRTVTLSFSPSGSTIWSTAQTV